jgi:hypothetical protein
VLCGRENFDQYLGPYGHPMVLYYQWKNGGLSFPLFHSSYGEHNQDRKETLELQYVQIYFHVMPGKRGAYQFKKNTNYKLISGRNKRRFEKVQSSAVQSGLASFRGECSLNFDLDP